MGKAEYNLEMHGQLHFFFLSEGRVPSETCGYKRTPKCTINRAALHKYAPPKKNPWQLTPGSTAPAGIILELLRIGVHQIISNHLYLPQETFREVTRSDLMYGLTDKVCNWLLGTTGSRSRWINKKSQDIPPGNKLELYRS